VTRDSHLLPNDLKQLVGQIVASVTSLAVIVDAAHRLAEALGVPVLHPMSLRDVQRLAQLGLKLANAPAMDHRQMGNPVWETRRDEVARLVEQGQALEAGRSAMAATVSQSLGRPTSTPRAQPRNTGILLVSLAPAGLSVRSPRCGAST
jgi:hypothetical protein